MWTLVELMGSAAISGHQPPVESCSGVVGQVEPSALLHTHSPGKTILTSSGHDHAVTADRRLVSKPGWHSLLSVITLRKVFQNIRVRQGFRRHPWSCEP